MSAFSPTVGKSQFCYLGRFMNFCFNSDSFSQEPLMRTIYMLQEREREGRTRRSVFHHS